MFENYQEDGALRIEIFDIYIVILMSGKEIHLFRSHVQASI